MKPIRLFVAAGLALAALGGVALALASWQPAAAWAEEVVTAPAAPQALPPPYLSESSVADAPYGSTPTVDGHISPGEYAGAGKATFRGYGGDVEVFFREDATYLYVAFDFPNPQTAGSAAQVFVDAQHDGGTAPQSDDYCFSVTRAGSAQENRGTGTAWGSPTAPISWTAMTTTSLSGWQAEFRIQYGKLGLAAGTFQVLGLSMINAWTPGGDYYWPRGAFWTTPSTWGHLTSSSDWGTLYWKPGPWQDYAPSGLPDFDQKQDGWFRPSMMGPLWTHCGPVAAANSLWWFDSKFETRTLTPPPAISDTYRLVRPYGAWDDHHTSNVVPLVDDLANHYFGTNQGITGTHIVTMFHGIQQYLRDRGLWDDYIVTLVVSPSIEWVAEEVMRSEDVILLLGFWEWVQEPDGTTRWARTGGHFVTVAGVGPMSRTIAFSDPFLDAVERGLSPWGRVLSGTLTPHTPIPHITATLHNDAGNVSHDIYGVLPTNSPGGTWGPAGYPWEEFEAAWGANPHPEFPTEPGRGGPLQVEVEYALAVSAYDWKASGYWDQEQDRWQPWVDYAPNGVPDFDQKQDNWMNPISRRWSFCGPAAAANSLWWFDSKFEPSPVGPSLPPYQPPIPTNDHYPLINTYASMPPLWDDHDPLNVEDQTAATQLVDDLALYLDTDGRQSGLAHSGTTVTDLYNGIEQYITHRGLRQEYVITQVKSPDFWWVAEEVEISEDVILLLGFWQNQSTGPGSRWVRLGGHYVTLPGVDKQGGYVGFSDPWFDRIERTWPYAGAGPMPGMPIYTGRVANGWLTPHKHPPAPPDSIHNDAGNVSHDVYRVVATDSPGGVWGPSGYVNAWGPDVENFWGQNGQGDTPTPTGDPIQTEVEWAVAVSPVADVWVRKATTPAITIPGQWVTFTIGFGNAGHTAENVVISDVLPGGLTNASATYTLNYTGTLVAHDTYTWTAGTLEWNQGGTITITARVDPTIRDRQRIITNTVEITTTTQEQYQVQALPNVASVTVTVQTADVAISKTAMPPTLRAGDWLTYTLVYTNYGPAAAASTVITDLLHTWLVNAGYSTWSSYMGVAPVPSGRYVWSMGSVPGGGWGIITVTAQVSPSLSGGGTLSNSTSIGTATPDRDTTNNNAQTSNIIVYYGVDLQPASSGMAANPGQTITYTLTLYNTGNVTDSYAITGSVAGRPWTTQWPGSAGPVAGGRSVQFNVTVHISSTATNGEWSRATITATSQGDKSKRDTSVLTTTAYAGTITRGVAVAPHTAAGTGNPGQTVTYTLRVTNTGNVADVIGLGHSGPSTWTVTYSANPLSLGAGGGVDVKVYAGIPASVSRGSTGIITVTATSQADPTKRDAGVLTTHVGQRFVYLPVVLRNYQ